MSKTELSAKWYTIARELNSHYVDVIQEWPEDRIKEANKLLEKSDFDARQYLIDTCRPVGSFLHSKSPCPPCFMQNGNLLIDGVNGVDVATAAKDPAFWWQPITNIETIMFTQAVTQYRNVCQTGGGVHFFSNIK